MKNTKDEINFYQTNLFFFLQTIKKNKERKSNLFFRLEIVLNCNNWVLSDTSQLEKTKAFTAKHIS